MAAEVDNPYDVAAAVETAVFKAFKMQVNKDYKAKVRTLLFNLKDAKNPDLRRKVLIGELQPGQLVTMTSEELASDDKKTENQEIRCAAASRLRQGCVCRGVRSRERVRLRLVGEITSSYSLLNSVVISEG